MKYLILSLLLLVSCDFGQAYDECNLNEITKPGFRWAGEYTAPNGEEYAEQFNFYEDSIIHQTYWIVNDSTMITLPYKVYHEWYLVEQGYPPTLEFRNDDMVTEILFYEGHNCDHILLNDIYFIIIP